MQIYTVQTQSNPEAADGERRISSRCRGRRFERRVGGLVLAELIVAILIMSLFLIIAQPKVFSLLGRSTFKGQIHDFVTTMEMAISAARESDKRYEVIIDVIEQKYILREMTSRDLLADVLEEEIIAEGDFGSKCQVDSIEFDDGQYSTEKAMFRASRAGWQAGGRIVFWDDKDRLYSVVVDRISGIVRLEDGDAELLGPVAENELGF